MRRVSLCGWKISLPYGAFLFHFLSLSFPVRFSLKNRVIALLYLSLSLSSSFFSLLRTGWALEQLECDQVSPVPLKPRGRDGQRPRAGPNCFLNRSAQSYNNSAQVLVLTMKPVSHSDFSLSADSTPKNAFGQDSFADTSLDCLLLEERSIDSWSRVGLYDQNLGDPVVSKIFFIKDNWIKI